ncbi:unnamed protein product [Phytophthora lilii]|uniref:Unnamed protein product n=1 Tax=Phytophthora lilii TaxID=2077276 RepID=A0A9W6XPJ8_9STRA|nr:unnamed protein product [Phytophthora lilii]
MRLISRRNQRQNQVQHRSSISKRLSNMLRQSSNSISASISENPLVVAASRYYCRKSLLLPAELDNLLYSQKVISTYIREAESSIRFSSLMLYRTLLEKGGANGARTQIPGEV